MTGMPIPKTVLLSAKLISFGMPVLSWLLQPVIRDLTHRLLVHPETPEKLSPLARMILPKEPM